MRKRSKRKQSSSTSLPKGLPSKKHKNNNNTTTNPFEDARASSSKAPKFQVHNRRLFSNSSENKGGGASSALQRSITERRSTLRTVLQQKKKTGSFIDRRIGEGGGKSSMTEEERMLARLVRERTRRSKGRDRFSLGGDGDDDGGGAGAGALGPSSTLTHRGSAIDESYAGNNGPGDYVILSDDDEDRYGGQLESADVEMHFGGGAFDRGRKRAAEQNPYGPSSSSSPKETLGDRYRSRKEELDDMIMRKKWEKAQKAKAKEIQADAFQGMDDNFKELAGLLAFTDKRQFRMDQNQARKDGTMSKDFQEMEEWDRSMKELTFERRAKATDRTKTPDEIANEKAERLNKLEARRIRRMNGDFEEGDDDTDTDDNDNTKKKNKTKKTTPKTDTRAKNPDELDSDHDEEESDELEACFTADGLVYVDKHGNVQKNPGTDDNNNNNDDDDDNDDDFDGTEVAADADDEGGGGSDNDSSSSDEDSSIGGSDEEASVVDEDDGEEEGSDDDEEGSSDDDGKSSRPKHRPLLAIGNRVKGRFEGGEKWYRGAIMDVVVKDGGDGEKKEVRYDVEYDDGEVEEGMKPEHVRLLDVKKGKKDGEDGEDGGSGKGKETKAQIAAKLLKKRQISRDKARSEIPYTFEVPTTLESLHALISTHARSGSEASLIIQRIHLSNSIRLDRTNREKMQNYYDVLLRRFIAVGDALYRNGDGGSEIGRYRQLDVLTGVLYGMAQDSPEVAGAVWGRRLGVFQAGHAKRIRDDADFVPVSSTQDDDEEEDEEEDDGGGQPMTVWPSPGTLLLLRAIGRIFPVTDARHSVVTPTMLLLGQILAQTPVRTLEDVVRGLFCAGLMVEFTREAGRVPPEAMAFLASVLALFGEGGADGDGFHRFTIPTFAVEDHDGGSTSSSSSSGLATLRQDVIEYCNEHDIDDEYKSKLRLPFERQALRSKDSPIRLFLSSLRLVERTAAIHGNTGDESSKPTTPTPPTTKTTPTTHTPKVELFDEITRSLLRLKPQTPTTTKPTPPLPTTLTKSIAHTAHKIQTLTNLGQPRIPLTRRSTTHSKTTTDGITIHTNPKLAIESLAPRMEDPDRYTMSRDKGKTTDRAKYDKHRREFKREHKAVSRELRLDARFIESERREAKEKRDGKAREKRNRNFAWMESEQAVINQQVAQGGGLLGGGGIGAAIRKKKMGRIGIKKGGKF